MSASKVWLVLGAAAAFGVGVALTTRIARAGDDKPPEGGMPGMPVVQKAIKHPFADCLLGTWTHETTAMWGTGKGAATYRLAMGGTRLIEDYESGMGDGKTPDFWGHSVTKISDDGKTATTWWFDSHSAEPLTFTGPLTDKGMDVSAVTPRGKSRITWEKTDTGLTMKLFTGEQLIITDVFKPAPK